MFKCQLTNRQSLPGQKPVRLVVLRRKKDYDKTIYDLETRQVSMIKGASHGWEVVRELVVCESAANEWCESHPNGADWTEQIAE
jgi:hypothetical protein